MAGKRDPIKIKAANQGKLRATTGTKKGQKIPVAKLKKLARSSNLTTKRRAVFALNAKGWSHK